jgi:nicotinamide-nucleotide amidase
MKVMMRSIILPRIEKRFHTQSIYHKVIKTTGIGESWLSDKIAEWEDQLPAHIKLAYLPSVMEVKLRLTASGPDKQKLVSEVEEEIGKLMPIVGKYIYGYNSDTLEKVVGEILLENHTTIATAESCTGGYLASKITSVPGSSAYFSGSIVSYSNDVKENTLGVPKETLQQFGAVSKETVSTMAQNVRNMLKAGIGVATSGIAGPSGGTEEKPVGTVWIAVADENGTTVKKFSFAKDRLVNIEASAKVALNMVRQRLNKNGN